MTASSIERPPSDLVTVEVSGAAPHVRVSVAGEIDSSSAGVLRDRLEPLLDGGTGEVTLDLCAVTFLDSAGLCVLAGAHRQAVAHEVRIRVLASSRAVIRPLQITGLFDLLHVEQVDPAPVTVVA